MAAVKFLLAAVAVGVVAGFTVVALAPLREIPTHARSAVKPVPPVEGQSLDDARARLDRQGISHETIGGGLFSLILDESNWTVCESRPSGPAFVEPGDTVTLVIEPLCI